MEVEFTARQVSVPRSVRTQAEEGLERIARILGKTARASITFRAQRHMQIVGNHDEGKGTDHCGSGQGRYA